MKKALGPLNLIQYSAAKETTKEHIICNEAIDLVIQELLQKAAGYINSDTEEAFLYKNPNGWHKRSKAGNHKPTFIQRFQDPFKNENYVKHPNSFIPSNASSSSEESFSQLESWCLLSDFKYPTVVHQITDFILTWQLTPATKFVVIAHEKFDIISPFGERYYVQAHFSKPTPKCPNPLAVAKVYFHINRCHLLPMDYPVNVTYKFEGHKSIFHAMGEKKMSSKLFQGFLIDTILHMKLAFYANFCECIDLVEKQDENVKDNK